jgi:hypothetical protein
MATPFCFEHVFRAPSLAAVFDAYFDPACVAHQDHALDLAERDPLEDSDDGSTRTRVCRIVPRRQLPAIVRPLLGSTLHYIETASWRRADDVIEVTLQFPALRSASVHGVYRLLRISEREIQRRYEGRVRVGAALLGSRIERGILAELERSVPVAAACLQTYLDRPKDPTSVTVES